MITAPVFFLEKHPLYDSEKPYSLRFLCDEIPRTNIKQDQRNVAIQDFRGRADQFCYKANGFTILKMDSEMKYSDFEDESTVISVYCREVEKALASLLGARRIVVYEHLIRRRHASFPVSAGPFYKFDQPNALAHVDHSKSSLTELIPELSAEFGFETTNKGRFELLNAWKPLRGPLRDWPLALCDSATVDREQDLVPHDIVYPDKADENLQVHFSPKQKWYYVSDQAADELLVFHQGQLDPEFRPGVPHCAFELPTEANNGVPRESIEVRALAYFEEQGLSEHFS